MCKFDKYFGSALRRSVFNQTFKKTVKNVNKCKAISAFTSFPFL